MFQKTITQLALLSGMALLVSCNSGSSSSPVNTLSAYPTSGRYIGYANSSINNIKSIADGYISGPNGNFNVISDGQSTITFVFQLNNPTCIIGSQSFDNISRAFTASNCSYNNGVFQANYETGFGDKGVFYFKLQ